MKTKPRTRTRTNKQTNTRDIRKNTRIVFACFYDSVPRPLHDVLFCVQFHYEVGLHRRHRLDYLHDQVSRTDQKHVRKGSRFVFALAVRGYPVRDSGFPNPPDRIGNRRI